ncbi:MAG: DNA polymerase III subunit delta [Candidatus Moranbacteria bacterium CG_4_9_14_3_um_filter_40_7]|nr:MAG: DNA polymerase III subunit delta [Candidatus Moranbacteria bacterium CG23_combo_of_CG06-09_8_20_14_all_40_16]PIU80951.1 MAG: DNA polymerase III subunit delta [Candidatus Moranbacteria bacterium CG06_land_8_20_14_3_00_40_12]PJA87434.1 MAG: DNA polymerase III subunit delta [Candidatus Moranbacteria bacterium CG_4_9_14_3_um_filter_40_7]
MIIFLYGEDAFRSNLKLRALKDKFLLSDTSASGLSVLDYGEKPGETKDIKLIDILESANLLSPKRLVIIKRIIAQGSKEEQENILAYLKKKQKKIEGDRDLVIVFWEEILNQKKNALFQFLTAEKTEIKQQEFTKLSGAKLEQWVLKRMQELFGRANISQKTLEKLIIFCGQDTRILNNEIGKLANFCDQKTIQEKDVEELVQAALAGNIFSIIDAVAEGRKKDALLLVHQHLSKGEDPFYLFSMLVYQLRNLLKVADLKENFSYPEREIIRVSQMHPFIVRKSLNQIRNFTFVQLAKLYQKLSQLDVMMKTGKVGAELALDKFIAEM